jgi:hypothetical protein
MKRKIVSWIISTLIMATVLYFVHARWYRNNKACHEQCKAQGFAAGEDEMLYEHIVCACFQRSAAPTARFVLEISQKLEK